MNFRSLPTAAAVACCLLSQGAHAFKSQDDEQRLGPRWAAEALTDRLIVKYRSGSGAYPTARGQAAALVAANRHGVQISHLRQTQGGAQVFRLNRVLRQADVESLASSLRNGDPNVEFAEADRLMQPMALPNDPMLAQQWSLSDAVSGIRAPAAWDRATGSGIVVAVIDTGVRPHADLTKNLLAGYDFIADLKVAADGNGREADAADPGDGAAAGYCGSGSASSRSSWHGTHVAGIVAASAGNGVGVAGVAHGARILPLRALGRCGGYTSDIADAMVWAAGGAVAGVPANATPARVLNLSLGGAGACSRTTQNAINSARAMGAVVVVAAGNENADAAGSSPANCSGVVVVAATGKGGGKASYSNTGANVTLAAPGGDAGAGILSTLNAGSLSPGADSYAAYMGTSMATPAVAGVAALMLSVNKKLSPDQVAAMLKASARAFPSPCPKCGAGIVDANAAVALAAGTSTTSPAPAPAPAPAPSPAPVVTTPGSASLGEVEPNDSLAKAQAISSLPVAVAGALASSTDLDHFKISLAGGKRLVATLSAGATSGFGLSVLTASGQTLLSTPGAAGRTLQVNISNGGSAAATLVLKVSRSVGASGSYSLQLAN